MPGRYEDLNRGGLWCPQCGDEYNVGAATECSYCRVALDSRPPEPPDAAEPVPLEPVEYDLSDWSEEQRAAVSLLLRTDGIEPMWEGTSLFVPRSGEELADAAIDEVDATFGIAAGPEWEPTAEFTPPSRAETVPASPWRRVLARVMDVVVLSLATNGVFQALVPSTTVPIRRPSWLLAWTIAQAVYEVGAIALWGRTLGKLVAGVRVVDATSRRLPTLRRSALRWFVLTLPFPVRIAGFAAVGWFLFAAQFVVAAGIFTARRQGLHDRAANTIVLRVR